MAERETEDETGTRASRRHVHFTTPDSFHPFLYPLPPSLPPPHTPAVPGSTLTSSLSYSPSELGGDMEIRQGPRPSIVWLPHHLHRPALTHPPRSTHHTVVPTHTALTVGSVWWLLRPSLPRTSRACQPAHAAAPHAHSPTQGAVSVRLAARSADRRRTTRRPASGSDSAGLSVGDAPPAQGAPRSPPPPLPVRHRRTAGRRGSARGRTAGAATTVLLIIGRLAGSCSWRAAQQGLLRAPLAARPAPDAGPSAVAGLAGDWWQKDSGAATAPGRRSGQTTGDNKPRRREGNGLTEASRTAEWAV